MKTLLWFRGGWCVHLGGATALAAAIRGIYAAGGARQFDCAFLGAKDYGRALEIVDLLERWKTLPK